MAEKDQDRKLGRNYDRAAWFYEASAWLFSGGRIRSSKKYAIGQLQPGDKAVFLGVGSGEEAVLAAAQGVQVTCLDLSAAMLDQLDRKLKARGLTAEIICGNALDHNRSGHYDAVVANYFLNVFLLPDMVRMLNHATTLVRPGGKFLIADVAQARGNPLAKLFNIVYLKMAMVSFWLLGLVPLHRNYDYTQHFDQAGLTIDHIRYFRFLKYGPVLFQTIVAYRK